MFSCYGYCKNKSIEEQLCYAYFFAFVLLLQILQLVFSVGFQDQLISLVVSPISDPTVAQLVQDSLDNTFRILNITVLFSVIGVVVGIAVAFLAKRVVRLRNSLLQKDPTEEQPEIAL